MSTEETKALCDVQDCPVHNRIYEIQKFKTTATSQYIFYMQNCLSVAVEEIHLYSFDRFHHMLPRFGALH